MEESLTVLSLWRLTLAMILSSRPSGRQQTQVRVVLPHDAFTLKGHFGHAVQQAVKGSTL